MPIRLETAGGHLFDLTHIRRQGGEELIGRLLEKAGLPTCPLWRVQVQKKLMCNSETPPVRVVDEPKRWAVYLKVKPGDNNSCHYVSLLMPDGLQGQSVYSSLKKAAMELDRNWRYRQVEPPGRGPTDPGFPKLSAEGHPLEPAPEPAETEEVCVTVPPANEPVDMAQAADESAVEGDEGSGESQEKATGRPSGMARGWLSDPEKTQLLLWAIHEISQEGTFPQERFVELLVQRLGWHGVNRYEVGGVFTTLVRRGFIHRRLQGNKPFGYVLTPAGMSQIADLIQGSAPAPRVAPPAAPGIAPTPDVLQAIRSFTPIAQRLLEANQRLEQVDAREAEINAELQRLRQEREEITRFLRDSQVQSVLDQLMRISRPGD
jgi:hypothetical protein